jgi:hypothetical protein
MRSTLALGVAVIGAAFIGEAMGAMGLPRCSTPSSGATGVAAVGLAMKAVPVDHEVLRAGPTFHRQPKQTAPVRRPKMDDRPAVADNRTAKQNPRGESAATAPRASPPASLAPPVPVSQFYAGPDPAFVNSEKAS